MSSSFSSAADSDAPGPAGGTDPIIYKNKPEHAYLHSHVLVGRGFPQKERKGKSSQRNLRARFHANPTKSRAPRNRVVPLPPWGGVGTRRRKPATGPSASPRRLQDEGRRLPAEEQGRSAEQPQQGARGPRRPLLLRAPAQTCKVPTPARPRSPGHRPEAAAEHQASAHKTQNPARPPPLTSGPGSPISPTAPLTAPALLLSPWPPLWLLSLLPTPPPPRPPFPPSPALRRRDPPLRERRRRRRRGPKRCKTASEGGAAGSGPLSSGASSPRSQPPFSRTAQDAGNCSSLVAPADARASLEKSGKGPPGPAHAFLRGDVTAVPPSGGWAWFC